MRKRILSSLLILCMVLTLLPREAGAEERPITSASAYAVTGLTVDGAAATVTYLAEGSATMVVALYDQTTDQLLTSGTAEVDDATNTAKVPIAGDMPEYFVARAFLLDRDTHAPLCEEYRTEQYIRTKTSAELYYEDHSELIDIIEMEAADDVLTETQAKSVLEELGFGQELDADGNFIGYPVTYNYSISGDYTDETEVSDGSMDKHPMYQTFYLSENREGWMIYIINGEVFANPVSFNLESDLDALFLVSTTETLTSYDNATNMFYETIPYASEVIVEIVDRIDAETLDGLTIEKICALTGATMLEFENSSETAAVSTFDEFEPAPVADINNSVIIVSLGDSYSSGEGIPPFSQFTSLFDKVKDENWLAHRSTTGWPTRLKVLDKNVQLYFGAVSGAETKNFDYNANDKDTKNGQQKKPYNKKEDGLFDGLLGSRYTGEKWLPNQLDIFDYIDELNDVDYVTLTIGGNDVDFVGVITLCAVGCTYLNFGLISALENKLNTLWDNIDNTMEDIKAVYDAIHRKAPHAAIIVTGYPKLLDENRSPIIPLAAQMVNNKVHDFNQKIKDLVESFDYTYFADVESKFDAGGGHAAYSKDAWINPIIIGPQPEDINDLSAASAYSVHPNTKGAQAYADCVNAVIEEIENEKNSSGGSGEPGGPGGDQDGNDTINVGGFLLRESDESGVIADYAVYDSNNLSRPLFESTTGTTGVFEFDISAGTYRIEFTGDNFDPVEISFSVESGQKTLTLGLIYVQTYVAGGVCGDNLRWKLSDAGVLTIYGRGDMYDFTSSTTVPWYDDSLAQPHRTIKTVKIEEGVTSIGAHAFDRCWSLDDVTIPNTVTTIGDYAFLNCSSMKNITIPSSVTSVGIGAFLDWGFDFNVFYTSGVEDWCKISAFGGFDEGGHTTFSYNLYFNGKLVTDLVIPDGVTDISNSAFIFCSSLTSVTIPDSVTSIGPLAFEFCSNLTNVTMSDGITNIGNNAFSHCTSLSNVTLPDNLLSIGDHAFYECSSLASLKIPDGVTCIGVAAFAGTALKEIAIPNGITSIPISMCNRCTSLTSVKIPSSITSIESYAFSGCSSLTDVYYGGSEEDWKNITLGSDNASLENANIHYNIDLTTFMGERETIAISLPVENVQVFSATSQFLTAHSYYTDEIHLLSGYTPTIHASEGDYVAQFTGLVPGECYALVVAVDIESSPLLAADNLLYIAQNIADSEGAINFSYIPRIAIADHAVRAYGPTSRNLADATVAVEDLIYDGTEQIPEVIITYDGTTLVENVDYTLTGDIRVTAIGTYSITAIGINGYTGSQTASYSVIGTGEDPEPPVQTCTLTVTNGTGGGDYEAGTQVSIVANAAPEGKVFDKWTTNNGGAFVDASSVSTTFTMPVGNVTVTATYRGIAAPPVPTTFLINFDPNGGTVDIASMTTGVDGKLSSLPIPIYNGYSFNGWFTALTGGNQVTVNTVFTSDATVYARWTYNGDIFGGNNRYPSTDNTAPTTYRIMVPAISGGTVNINPTSAKKGDTVTIIVTPDSGYELDYITVTDKNGDNVPLTDCGNGNYIFTVPDGNVTLDYAFRLIKTDSTDQPAISFIDVVPNTYYYNAVTWAVVQRITNGTTATTFSPNAPCTRGQIVTFLWRAAGSPSVSGNNPFTDVQPGDYWYDAVLWAVSKGITTGTSATTFSPNDTCTRSQAVTFLYRNAGSPAVTTSAAFTDVVPGAYYSDAVTWALAKNFTNGTTATTFSPDDKCTRGQIVTLLYRNLGE